MKKILISIFLLLLIFGGAHAQTDKGKFLVGGSIGASFGNSYVEYDGTKDSEKRTSSFSLSPKVGYFLIDGLAVGASLGADRYIEKDEGDDFESKYVSSYLMVSPFVRYYSPIGLFGEAYIGIGRGNTRREVDGQETTELKSKLFGWSLGAGYAFFLNENVSIEPMISYNKTTADFTEDADSKRGSGEFMIEVGFSIFL